MTIIQVALPLPLPQSFDYLLAKGGVPVPGSRVLVPFGRGHSVGIVTGSADTSEVPASKLKAVARVLDPMPVFNEELLATLTWAARYYQHPIGEVLTTALPVALRAPRDLPDSGEPALRLTATGFTRIEQGKLRSGSRVAAVLERLVDGPVLAATLDGELPGWRSSATSLRRSCSMVLPAAARPKSICGSSPRPSRVASKRWCCCRKLR